MALIDLSKRLDQTARQLCAVISALILTAITTTTLQAEEASLLESQKWTITTVGTHEGPQLGFIKFNNGQLEGQATCNSYSAVYSTKENNIIEVYRIGVTQLICKVGNKMEIEDQYLSGLETASRYEIKDNMLTLYDKKDSVIARFK